MMGMRETDSILPLNIRELGYIVDGKALLDNVTFLVPKSGLTAIIGPNGAGKSLLLRLCHGLIMPTHGDVQWSDDRGLGRSKRHAMVFQRPVMLRRSTSANIAHALAAQGHDRAEARTAEALARFGLETLKDRPARLLSGGEQQRLAIARAWALEPEVLFLDEPTSQLDPGATRQIEQIIAKLEQDGITILMATHDLAQARRLSRRTLFFNKGKLVEDATTDAFFTSAATAEAKAFVAGELLW
jgi:tungstate transport system ATP-binding protein